MRVVEARARVADDRLRERVLQQLVVRPVAERLRELRRLEGRVLLDVVGVAGGDAREHPQRHLVGVGVLREPLRQGVVEAELALFLQLQHQSREHGDRHRAGTELHVRRRRHSLLGIPETRVDDGAVVDVDAQEHPLGVLLLHDALRDRDDLLRHLGLARARAADVDLVRRALRVGRRARADTSSTGWAK